jgi:hypothetical protein
MASSSHRVAFDKRTKRDLRFYVPRHPGCLCQPSAPVLSPGEVANDGKGRKTVKYQSLLALLSSTLVAIETFDSLVMTQLPSSSSSVIES